MCGVVHAVLEGAVEVGEGLCAACEAHVFAEVVAALDAVRAGVAHDARLDGDALADDKVLYAGAYGRDGAGGLVAEDEWCLERKVSVAAVEVIVHCARGWVRGGGERRK